MVLNKKGIEWPITLVYVFFCIVLLLIGALYLATLVSSADVAISDQLKKLRYKILASRLLYSSDCLAVADINEHCQVRAGVINMSRYQKLFVKQCLHGKKFYLNLIYTDGHSIALGKQVEDAIGDYFFVKVRERDGSFSDAILYIEIKP